eukprot:2267514-Rhodomonas_salina.1
MPKSAFAGLVDLLVPILELDRVRSGKHNSAKQSVSASPAGEITTVLKVSLTLQWLAGGSYLDIVALH